MNSPTRNVSVSRQRTAFTTEPDPVIEMLLCALRPKSHPMSPNTLLIRVGYGDGEITVLKETVLVFKVFIACSIEGFSHRVRMAAPLALWNTTDGPLSVPLVEIQVAFEFSNTEVRHSSPP